MQAVAEAATSGEGPDFGEPFRNPACGKLPFPEIQDPRRVDHESSLRERVQGRHGGGMPTLSTAARKRADGEVGTGNDSSYQRRLAGA